MIMQHQQLINLLDNTLIQPSKLRARVGLEINNDSLGTYNINSQIQFKTSMLKSNLCDYSGAYILVKGTLSVANTAEERAAANNNNKKVIFKNSSPFTDCISE